MHIATSLLLIMAFAAAVVADEPPDAIRGKAFLAGSDRPAAHVTLRFFGRGAPLMTVVTDAGGRFRCPIPTGLSVSAGPDGQEGPPCWMEIQEASRWTWAPITSESSPGHVRPAHQQLELLRQAANDALIKPVKATWRDRGGLSSLEVACAPTGEVEVLVRGAGGSSLADRAVQVIAAFEPPETSMPVSVRFDGRTDVAGRFRMRWPEGIRRLTVVVPGEGFGSTGLFEVVAGQVARLEMAPLARLGSIEGRLDPTLAGPSTTVVLESQGRHIRDVACDAQGRFVARDVRPGWYRLRLLRDKRPVATELLGVRVTPGQRVADVVIGPPPASPPRELPDQFPGGLPSQPGGGAEEVVWVEGTVRDEQGRGVAEADVYARVEFDGGIRIVERVRKATTDDRGRYQVRGPKQSMVGAPALIVHAEGRPPALAFGPPPAADGRTSTVDLMLADASRGGSARVTVLKDGQPMAGANVGLTLLDANVPLFAVGRKGAARGPDRDAIEAMLHPTAVTGPEGVARFTNLFPGAYELTATERGPARFIPWARDQGLVFGIAKGLTVTEGRETAFAIAIHPQPCTARFQVLRPDGTPVAGQNVSLSFGLGKAQTGTSVALDGQGKGRRDFDSPGLWSIDVRFRDTALTSFPAITEPFYQAEAVMPVSPGLPSEGPLRLVGVRREPGSLRVRLLGADGRPARGTVQTVEFFNQPEFAASTDEQGVVVFRGVPGGSHRLRGFIDGLTVPVPEASPSRPLPEDSALRGQAVVPITMATVTSGRESTVELRARPVGYVCGTLRPSAGHKAAEYDVSLDIDWNAVDTQHWFDRESGRFLYGPLLPGKVAARFQHRAEDGTSRDAGVQTFEVAAGDVLHVELRPEESKPGSAPGPGRSAVPGMESLLILEHEPGAVVLHDGKAPAFAAQAILYVPEYTQPVGSGTTDAAGRLTWHGLWVSGDSATMGRAGPVERPTVVVRIPGRTGAAIVAVEPGRSARAILPAPLAVEGRVSLGGQFVDGRNARIRVVAAHKGRGPLDEALSVEATAQADGRFELRGLTPGRYAVQAARDGIWLSPSIELTVGADQAPPASLALDIPEPGRPLVLQVLDREGRPAAEWPIGLVRPEGPLAALWPASLRTGPDGTLTLRGLEAGRHTILVGEEKERREVVVPADDGADSKAVVERIVVPRTGP
jgi:protocatechuate 3,4-dioxygenase beta subunit